MLLATGDNRRPSSVIRHHILTFFDVVRERSSGSLLAISNFWFDIPKPYYELRVKDLVKVSELQEKAFDAQCQINKEYKKIPGLRERFQIIEDSFAILESFLTIPFEKNEVFAVAIREMVLRAHKTLQATTLNATAGIEIPTMSLLRDLIEIEFLLRYFEIYPDKVSEWWHADRKTRLREYSPNELRKHIAKKFPKLKKPMEDDYLGHCEIATHPTPLSLKLQSEFKNNSLFPPSQDWAFVWACIMEVAFHAERMACLVAYFGDMIYPQLDFKKKVDKLQKLTPNFPIEKKAASYILYAKLARVKEKHSEDTL